MTQSSPSRRAAGAPAATSASRSRLGLPRLHVRSIGSTNDRARELAAAGAPHGTLVTAGHQRAGRGRQGRTWIAPPGSALLMSVVVRDSPRLLPLVAGVAVAAAIGPEAAIKWPNDVLVGGRKVAGILVEARPQDGWAVVGVGVNVAVRPEDLPEDVRARAGTLGRTPADVEPLLEAVLAALEDRLAVPAEAVLAEWRERDALAGHEITWAGGRGLATGVDGEGRLLVVLPEGGRTALDAGEVHLGHGPGG
jgi:BirA family transcriptional regulator, biotin operon repressor / biotin---[acetyl-CoA-carboxylase] ligase